jgi:predicted DNA-binding protein
VKAIPFLAILTYICYNAMQRLIRRGEQVMKKTMIYLPEETHEGLRRMAFESKTSIAALIRQAVDRAYREDLEDIRDMEEELALYRADPASAIEFEEYLRQRKTRVSD